jgi:hypothetical protein
MSEYRFEWPRHLSGIERLDEQTRVSDLSAAAAAHEAPKLILRGAALPRRLLLQGAEGSKLSLSVDDGFHRCGTESADQLVLEICVAPIETQPFHLRAGEVRAEAGPLETAPEVALLCGVVETRKSDVESLRAEPFQELSYGLRTPDRYHGNAVSVEIPASALSERFERALVADPFDEHDCTRVDVCGQMVLIHVSYLHSPSLQIRLRDVAVPLAQEIIGCEEVES